MPVTKKITKVSVVMPYRNRESVIRDTIKSVLNQTYDNWELIAVNDGSTDLCTDILQQYAVGEKRIKLYKNLSGKPGPSVCRNIGISYANGDYITFLDSDDLLAPYCLQQRAEIMEANQELDFAVFSMGMFNEQIGDIHGIFNKVAKSTKDYLKCFLSLDTPWTTTCPIWKAKYIKKVGGFNESFLVKTDPELHSRVLLLHQPNFQYFKNEKVDCYYRINYFDAAKSSYIAEASIKYRIKYLKTVFGYFKQSTYHTEVELKNSLRKGLYVFYKTMFISVAEKYPGEYFELLNWAKQNTLIKKWDYHLFKWIGKIKNEPNGLLKKMHIPGLLYKLN